MTMIRMILRSCFIQQTLFLMLWGFISTSLLCSGAAAITPPRECGGAIRHVHLAVGPEPSTSMIVSFASIRSRFTPIPVGGVRLGTRPDQFTVVQLEDVQSPSHYYVTQGRDSNVPYYSPYYHHVVVTNLEPSTTYYYQPVVQATPRGFEGVYGSLMSQDDLTKLHNKEMSSNITAEQWKLRRLVRWGPYDGSQRDCPSPSKIRSFTTAPAAGSTFEASFAILGDLGQFPHSEETLTRLLRSKHELDAAILAGDIAYTGMDHYRWDTFFDFLDDYMAFEAIPLQLCPGNHDIDKIETSNGIFLAYEHRFRMPQIEPAQLGEYEGRAGALNMDQPPYPLPYEYGNSYYSWKYAGAHFIMVNAYAAMEPGSKQRRFIHLELQRVDREVTPWLIVVIHTPIYNTFGLHLKDPQIKAAKEHLEPLFVQYNVNIVFSGHIHAYARTEAVALDQLNPKGPVHITVGAGGRKCEAPFLHRDKEDWVAMRDATMYGFGILRIHNATIAEWDWVHTSPTDDNRDYNQLQGSNERLELSESPQDHVFLKNQYYL